MALQAASRDTVGPRSRRWEDVKQQQSYHQLLPGIGIALERMAAASSPDINTPFDSVLEAAVSVKDYLVRFCKYANCSPATWVTMFALILRVSRVHRLTVLNVHRLISVTFVIAAKLCDDWYYGASFYATLGGLEQADLVDMETIFLGEVNWDIGVSGSQYLETCKRIRELAASPVPKRSTSTRG
eukprot:TRINITY_DN71079_c0_g1_i1.p1 TRINITY_DN71079_c0_g1~~TRINITY_DN71079_c0_g1_i1.p1  ORF type:complete len:216 (+),score=53.88 TRINITY_DN71079_c0_g1_i1:94-648(+)